MLFRWWRDELAALVPAPLQQMFKHGRNDVRVAISGGNLRLQIQEGAHVRDVGIASGKTRGWQNGAAAVDLEKLAHAIQAARCTTAPLARLKSFLPAAAMPWASATRATRNPPKPKSDGGGI